MARHNAVGPLALWLMIISLGLLAVALWLLFADEALTRLVRDARYEALPHTAEAYDLTMIEETSQ